ncbi:MAG: M4 family metallopeptidase, partial [Phycisphaerales bacterium]|nr:M4 family metallopeptidase [Phycisphaerales bacterium]
PANLAGTYLAGGATYGPPLTETGLTGRLVLADPRLACPTDGMLNNAAQIAGNIAVVDRGGCDPVVKSANAQNAGAIGAVIVNNRAGRPPIPGGIDPSIVIPTVGVTQFDGQAFEAALANGETVEITMRANGTDGGVRWLVGESSSVGPIRDMWKPTCRFHPDRANHPFQTCDPTDNGGVHSGSGVPNHAFALVTDGGVFNGFTVDGIGPIKSGAVWYRALTTYLSVASDFEDAYAALNQAAADWVGAFPLDPRTGFPSDSMFTADDAGQVDLALRAVEMNTPGLCGALAPILDPTPPTFCPSRLTIYQDDFEHGIADWTVSNTGPTGPPTPYNWVQKSGLPMQMPGVGWFAEDRDIGNCQSVDESAVHWLLSPSIDLFEDATTPTLTFTHFITTEPTYDGGNLKIKVNDGDFVLVPPTAFTFNAYNSLIHLTSSNPMAGEPAFTGLGGTWGTSVVDLSGFAGPNDRVRFRFDFGKDGCTGIDGWYLSDLAVFTCLPAGDGDFDGNRRVDLTDYAAFQRCMGQSTPGGSACAAGDLNGSGIVDISDHAFLVKALSGP